MDFLKKHYEKNFAGRRFAGLVAAAVLFAGS